jgi:8-hydroxy-5-deazaflavin:NADPH oxidoreductase
MNIAIIGAGNVGGTLGGRWAHNGHKVTFGVRNPMPKCKRQSAPAGRMQRQLRLRTR